MDEILAKFESMGVDAESLKEEIRDFGISNPELMNLIMIETYADVCNLESIGLESEPHDVFEDVREKALLMASYTS